MGAVSSAFVLDRFFIAHILSFRFTNESLKTKHEFELSSQVEILLRS